MTFDEQYRLWFRIFYISGIKSICNFGTVFVNIWSLFWPEVWYGPLLETGWMQVSRFITRETWAAWNTVQMISVCFGIIGYIITSNKQKCIGTRHAILRNSSNKWYILARYIYINISTLNICGIKLYSNTQLAIC
jgi:hypothetical protein